MRGSAHGVGACCARAMVNSDYLCQSVFIRDHFSGQGRVTPALRGREAVDNAVRMRMNRLVVALTQESA